MESSGFYTCTKPPPGRTELNGNIWSYITNKMTGSGIIFNIIIDTNILLILSIINSKIGFHIGINDAPPKTPIPFTWPFGCKPRCWPTTWWPRIWLIAQSSIFICFIEISKNWIVSPFHCSCRIYIHFFPIACLQVIKCVVVCGINIHRFIEGDRIHCGRISVILNKDLSSNQQTNPVSHFNSFWIVRPFGDTGFGPIRQFSRIPKIEINPVSCHIPLALSRNITGRVIGSCIGFTLPEEG